MSSRRREILFIFGLLSTAMNLFLIGINWGLPSRRVDPFLFGDHPVWSGQQIQQLAGTRNDNANVGADVDANSIENKLKPCVVNSTDQQRAEIVRRYRLYSQQPDEMITLMSLATIRQHHGDPRLYQYGGLWIYPVGALLEAASILHLIDLRSDPVFYLDHPEAFARFYVVARLYSVAWGVLGAWAVFCLAKRMTRSGGVQTTRDGTSLTRDAATRLTSASSVEPSSPKSSGGGDIWIAAAAAISYAMLPVVINAAHEAKPHLAGMTLELFALIAALKYIETGQRKWAIGAGALCGAAAGMVLSGAISFILLPFMALERSRVVNLQSPRSPLAASRIKRLGSGALYGILIPILSGCAVFAITNPFVLIHLLGDPTILKSNLSNSQDMYRTPLTMDGVHNALQLLATGTSPIIAAMGVLCAIVSLKRHEPARSLLMMLAMFVAAQFVLLATDKPAEYARFGLFPDIALMLAAIIGVGSIFKRPAIKFPVLFALLVCIGIFAAGYVWNFGRDSVARTTRLIDAARLRQLHDAGANELAVYADPAPYCLPPVNLFDWRIMLQDRGGSPPESSDLMIVPTDAVADRDMPMLGYVIQYWNRPKLFKSRPINTPICWAAKPFRVVMKRELSAASNELIAPAK